MHGAKVKIKQDILPIEDPKLDSLCLGSREIEGPKLPGRRRCKILHIMQLSFCDRWINITA
jgi:hypothetical protein